MTIDEGRITRLNNQFGYCVYDQDDDGSHGRYFATLAEALESCRDETYHTYSIVEQRTVAIVAPRAMTADELEELASNDRRSAAIHASWDVVRVEMGKFDYEDPRANEIFLREMERRGYAVKR